MDIKILVAAHKNYWMPADDVYMPLQVGAEGKELLGYTPDNTGTIFPPRIRITVS